MQTLMVTTRVGDGTPVTQHCYYFGPQDLDPLHVTNSANYYPKSLRGILCTFRTTLGNETVDGGKSQFSCMGLDVPHLSKYKEYATRILYTV